MSMKLAITILSAIAAIFTALYAAFAFHHSIKSFREQLTLVVFTDYTKRYQEIFLHLPVNVGADDFDYEALDENSRDEFCRYMRAYFDLCSEEYFLSLSGKIDALVWQEWESGIVASFRKPAFQLAWKNMKSQRQDHWEFAKFVESINQRKYS